MKLRAAMVCTYYPPHVGGIASQVQGIAQSLAALGVETHVVTRRWDQPGPPEIQAQEDDRVSRPVTEPHTELNTQVNTDAITEAVERGVHVHRLALPSDRWQASPAFVWQCASRLRSLQPDVIHAHELLLPTTAALLAKHLLGRPVVVTVHSSGAALGECARLQRATLGRGRVNYVRAAVDRFVAISKVVAADLDAMGVPAQKQAVIPNGIDMARFSPLSSAEKTALRRRLGLPDGPLVVYTGRLASEKRVLPLAEQWRQLRAAHPDAALLLVGDGPDLAALRDLAAPGVLLLGAQADVAPLLQAADLFVMPSVSEGFSLSTLEALACGLPAVATRVGAIPELVDDPHAGTLVEPDDMAGLLAALCRLLEQRAHWPGMGAAARQSVVGDYSLATVAQKLLDLYRQL